MNAFIFLVCSLFLTFWLPAFAEQPRVLVSVAPYKYFIEKIAGETLEVQLMVPAGASAHTYEPTARQMISASKALLWFRVGEPFEERAIQAFRSHHQEMEVIDLRKGLNLIHHEEHSHRGCCPGHVDLHYWLSARLMKQQVETICEVLSKKFPAEAASYQIECETIKKELEALDHHIESLLKPLTNRNILVSHPAYAYFCRDYALKQYSIEVEGKDPTPQQLTRLLKLAKELHFHKIFVQMQYSNKAAKLVAETIGAKIVTLDPYSEYYFKSMEEIAHAFASKDIEDG